MGDSDNITRLEHQGREIFLIGTAHISKHSVEEVRDTILSLRPNTVCVELDQSRHDALIDDSGWRRLDLPKAIKEQRVLFLLVSLGLSAYQKKMGDKLGVRPGAELLAAVSAAHEVSAELVLADREVQITLKRAWRGLSGKEKAQLLGLFGTPPEHEAMSGELTEERVEQLKDKQTMSDMLMEMTKALPGIKRPLIDERDLYLISKIRESQGARVVAVVGAGHVKGMVENLNTPVDRTELEKVPPPAPLGRILRWLVPALALLMFFVGYSRDELPGLWPLLHAWGLSTAGFALLTALVARAKPLTVLLATLLAPVLALDPKRRAGRLLGLVEYQQGPPTDADKQAVRSDILSRRGVYANRFTRIALVSVLASLGSTLGAWVGALWVFARL
ncbi:MAG: TraB/GumN family protein [Polyangiaceae bacterium]|nr:TraB/GumN family protein [Polyangiaceae bacterium]